MGIYALDMTCEQFERLPAVLREIGLPEPRVTRHEGGSVYTFKLGVLRKLRVDVLNPEGSCKTYALWIPPTGAGTKLFQELKRRGHCCNPLHTQQRASPNGGPGTHARSSGASDGPPSVS